MVDSERGSNDPEESKQPDRLTDCLIKTFVTKNHEMSFGFIQLKKVCCSPIRDRVEARRNIRKESRKLRVSRKDTKAEVVICIACTVKTSLSKCIRQRGTVKIEE